ncbi:MAG: flagellar hook-basal body protein, partial [Firmicutes bacterium]|nr:flagellar hook-basal body protein [Bacillota bacterium]
FSVTAQGQVDQNGAVVGQIALANLPAGQINALGNNLYTAAKPTAFSGQVVQGAYTTGNVDVTQQAMDMMQAQTSYQALAQLVQSDTTRMKTADSLSTLT